MVHLQVAKFTITVQTIFRSSCKLCTLFVFIAVFTFLQSYAEGDIPYLFIPTGANFIIAGRGSNSTIVTHRSLAKSGFDKRLAEIASGKRVQTFSNDPAVAAVAEKIKSITASLRQSSANKEDMRNYIKFVDGALGSNADMIKRIRLLAVKASNSMLNIDDREIIQSEVTYLIDAINQNARFANFNRKLVLAGVDAASLGLDKVNLVKSPTTAIGICDQALDAIIRLRSVGGARSNLLQFQIKGELHYLFNIESALSRSVDADVANSITEMITHGQKVKVADGVLIMRLKTK